MSFARAACSSVALILVLGACAGDDDATDAVGRDTTISTSPATIPAGTPPAADPNRLAFTPVGGSALAGDVSVEGDDAGTVVQATIRSSTDGAVHKGHVHSGTCSSIGGVVAPLDDIRIGGDGSGSAESKLQLPMATVMNGQHVVAYHAAGGTPGAPAVCAAVPAH